MLLPKKQSACIIIHAKERTRESFFLVFFLRTFIIIIILLSMSKRNAIIKNVVCLFYRCSYALEFYHIWMKRERINSVTKLSDFKLFVEGISSEDMSKN